jgi:hypothetical protein
VVKALDSAHIDDLIKKTSDKIAGSVEAMADTTYPSRRSGLPQAMCWLTCHFTK